MKHFLSNICILVAYAVWLHQCTAGDVLSGLVRMEVEPSEVVLRGPRSSVQMIVTGYFDGGFVRDLTRVAEYRGPAAINIESGFVTPRGDGNGILAVACGDQMCNVSVTVDKFGEPAPVSFRLETLAVLTKQGCNSGSCHGKPNGRGALELSLNAFDPLADERTLIRAPLLRFTHPLEPTESLLLRKPLLQLPHGGGKRLRPGEAAYAILRQWIEEGCRPDPQDAPRCVKVEVLPPSGRVLKLDQVSDASQTQQQVCVVAHYSDGTHRDVTRIASFSVSQDRIAKVDQRGLVTGLERGQTAVVVRYLDDIVATHVTFVRDVPGFVWNDYPENNFIDQLVHQKLRQLQYLPAETCDDSVFIRRLSLDVRGLLPSVAETTAFLADSSPSKRSSWIDCFLESQEYARFWGLRMADLLRINKEQLSEERAAHYSRWVHESLAHNQPYDEFVRELLLAQGDTLNVPAANFYRVTSDTNTVIETVAQLFMGSRVMCAQCHNHPYESWTQDNYYQIGAAFHEIDRKVIKPESTDTATKRKRKRQDKADARTDNMVIEMTHGRFLANPRTGAVQKPWPTTVDRSSDEDKRLAFANWLTAKGNPLFARVAVNRIWAHLLGRGIVEPIDDFRSSNPAVNKELLDALAHDFEASGFDRRHCMRRILNSRTYQRSSQSNALSEADGSLFSHARTRMLSAEQMQDAIRRVCERHDRIAELQRSLASAEEKLQELLAEKPGAGESMALTEATKQRDEARAKVDEYYMTQQAYPHLTSFLKAFGQSPRQTACACERREDASLDRALQLMNSELVRELINDAAGRFESLADDDFLKSLYLAAFSREPNSRECEQLKSYLGPAPARRLAIEDILWSVINTNEFMFQH